MDKYTQEKHLLVCFAYKIASNYAAQSHLETFGAREEEGANAEAELAARSRAAKVRRGAMV